MSRFLVKNGYLKTPAIIEVFQKIDRRDFVLPEYAGHAYSNLPLPIGKGQNLSQPLIVAFMLELLTPQKGEKVLEIGFGSGWQTALLAELVGEEGRVITMEIDPELKKNAEENLEKYGFLEKGTVKVILGDGSFGYADEAPFDKIIISGRAERISDDWKKQLKLGGRLVAPVKDSIVFLEKIEADCFLEKNFFGFKFASLKSD